VITVALAWVVAIACLIVAAITTRGVRKLSRDAESLLADVRSLIRRNAGSEAELLSRVFGDGSSTDAADRVILLNERLGEIARQLDVGALIPAFAPRIALATAGLLAVVELAGSLGGPKPAVTTALAAFAPGVVAMALGIALQKSHAAASARTREAWNELGRLLTD
jgi:hypothetical protein